MMTDREKVIKALECCLTFDSPCGDCPYYSYEDIQELDCERNLRHDVLSLLKEQQADIEDLMNLLKFPEEWERIIKPVEPEADQYGNKHCGKCGHRIHSINDIDLYCPKCGRSVKWE